MATETPKSETAGKLEPYLEALNASDAVAGSVRQAEETAAAVSGQGWDTREAASTIAHCLTYRPRGTVEGITDQGRSAVEMISVALAATDKGQDKASLSAFRNGMSRLRDWIAKYADLKPDPHEHVIGIREVMRGHSMETSPMVGACEQVQLLPFTIISVMTASSQQYPRKPKKASQKAAAMLSDLFSSEYLESMGYGNERAVQQDVEEAVVYAADLLGLEVRVFHNPKMFAVGH